MPKELFPSSYLCDCGHQSDFFENTIREAKAMSQRKKVYLADSAPEEHTIVFYRGEDRKYKATFSPCRGHRLPLARLRRQPLPARGAGGVPSTPQRPVARRDAALRRLDMPLRMGCGRASRVSAARASGRPGWEGRGARFLVEQGIERMSLNPDAVRKTLLAIAAIEKTRTDAC